MQTIRFLGRVLPKTFQVSLSNIPDVNWADSELGQSLAFKIGVQSNLVDVQCTLEEYDPSLLDRIYLRAFDLVSAPIDLLSFAKGYGLTVVIEKFVDDKGAMSAFVTHDPHLAQLCTVFNLDSPTHQPDFNNVLTLAMSDWRIIHMLRELVDTITEPHIASKNCARAIEGLRNIISDNPNRSVAWKEMRDALNISESYIRPITEISVGTRHGHHDHIPGPVLRDVTARSWTIMNRFLEMKKRGQSSLLTSEFPLLN
jgi:hypothetical protein